MYARNGRIVLCLITLLCIGGPVFAQKSKYSAPKSGSSSKSSSGSSSQSKPKYSAPKSSSPPQSSNSKPKYSAPSSSQSSTSSSKPKYSAPSTPSNSSKKPPVVETDKSRANKVEASKNKYVQEQKQPKEKSNPSVVINPSTKTNSSVSTNSKKPPIVETDKSRANKVEASKNNYVKQQKATEPPKDNYVASNGKTVKINPKDKRVEEIRNRSTEYYQPTARKQRIETHFHNYHYHHPYDYYYSRPYYHVGGGYSSAFWWMMMEWNAERRAMWLYHNRHNIDQSSYSEGLRDGEVRARLEALERDNVLRDPNYVDSEFSQNPSDMYDASYIEAAYNPQVQAPIAQSKPMSEEERVMVGHMITWIIISAVTLGGVCFAVWFVTCVRFGK